MTELTDDGHGSQMLNREELTPAAMWMPLLSFQHSCYCVVPLMASILSISLGISHWKGSERFWSDSDTNTALSSHCHICSPWAHAAAYSNRHEFGNWWQLVSHSSFQFFFWIPVFNKSLLCVAVISVQREKLLCDCSSIPAESRTLTCLPELSGSPSDSFLCAYHSAAATSMCLEA